jgi:hypothetical protein
MLSPAWPGRSPATAGDADFMMTITPGPAGGQEYSTGGHDIIPLSLRLALQSAWQRKQHCQTLKDLSSHNSGHPELQSSLSK